MAILRVVIKFTEMEETNDDFDDSTFNLLLQDVDKLLHQDVDREENAPTKIQPPPLPPRPTDQSSFSTLVNGESGSESSNSISNGPDEGAPVVVVSTSAMRKLRRSILENEVAFAPCSWADLKSSDINNGADSDALSHLEIDLAEKVGLH